MSERRKLAVYAPAALLLALGLRAFWHRYPAGPESGHAGAAPAALRDAALPASLLKSVSFTDTVADADTAPVPDPFRLAAPSAPKAGHAEPKAAPLRKWKLRGTTGNAVATLVDSVGAKHLLRVGEAVAGTRLLEVQSHHVKLQDAAGIFELELEP